MDCCNFLRVFVRLIAVLLTVEGRSLLRPNFRSKNLTEAEGHAGENNSHSGAVYESPDFGLHLNKLVKENEARYGNVHGHIVAVNKASVEASKKSKLNSTEENILKLNRSTPIMEQIVTLNEGNYSHELPFEGDIELSLEEKTLLASNQTAGMRTKRNVITVNYKGGGLWPNGEIYYAIANNLAYLEPKINAALKKFQEKTCLKFNRVLPSYSGDYILFNKGNGCTSRVGRVGGMQEISLGKGCEYIGVIMHEIMHALGIWHEQSRPDRDKHVLILWKNIEPKYKKHFGINTARELDTLQLPYDYISIMHYDRFLFSKSPPKGEKPRPSIVRRRHPWRRLGSQREGEFTAGDIAEIKTLYKCS